MFNFILKFNNKTNRGFSLAEILVSVSILLVFIVAISGILVNTNKQLSSVNMKEKAVSLAEELIEKSRNTRNADYNNLIDYSDVIDSTYTRSLTVSIPNPSFPDQKRVDVVVTWSDRLSSSNSVNLSAYLTNWKAPMAEIGLTVNKVVINHGGSKTSSDFEPYQVEGYMLNNETDPPTTELNTLDIIPGQVVVLSPGTYTISEASDPEYIQTFSGDCDVNGEVVLASGDSKVCTITNEQKYASLLLNKIVINHGLTKVVDDFAPYMVNTNPTSELTLGVASPVGPGTWTISETLDTLYNQTFSGDCDSSGVVSILVGESKTCTITNEEKLSYLTINKNVINHGNTNVSSSFAPFMAGANTIPLGVETNIDSGIYGITESNYEDYDQTFSGDCDTNGFLTLISGENKTCTITNEEKPKGFIVYGNGTSTPKYRNYFGDNTTSVEKDSILGDIGRVFETETSPIKREAIAGYVNNAGLLHVMCFDGKNWQNEWSVNVGGTGTTRRFDIEYETNSGDAIVLYSTNTATNNELAYRTKSGGSACGSANWSNSTNISSARTSGIIHWVKMARDRRSSSNLIGAVWADANSDLSASIWNGTGWVNEPTFTLETSLEVFSTSQDIEDFDIEYESLSGDIVVVWANSVGKNGTNGVRYSTCTGGVSGCYWLSVTTPPTFSDDATNLDISANPNTDQMVFASIGNAGSDLQMGYWSGSSWTNTANADTSCSTPSAGTKKLATGWLVSGGATRSVITYQDSGLTNIGWYVGNNGAFTLQTDFTPTPAFSVNQGFYEIKMDPINKDRLIFGVADGANDLFIKRLIMTTTPTFSWTNIGTALSTNLPQNISNPFSFEFWK